MKAALTILRNENLAILNEILTYTNRNAKDGEGWVSLDEGVAASAKYSNNHQLIKSKVLATIDFSADCIDKGYEADYIVYKLVHNKL